VDRGEHYRPNEDADETEGNQTAYHADENEQQWEIGSFLDQNRAQKIVHGFDYQGPRKKKTLPSLFGCSSKARPPRGSVREEGRP
jgi:hypothetical protein